MSIGKQTKNHNGIEKSMQEKLLQWKFISVTFNCKRETRINAQSWCECNTFNDEDLLQ